MAVSQPTPAGRITQDVYAKGTKSEHDAVFIETADSRYIFRRKKGPAFGNDDLTHISDMKSNAMGFCLEKHF